MSHKSAEWHLLFGLLALQNGLVSREKLVAAFAKWTSDKSKPIDEWLIMDGALSESRRDILSQLIEVHIADHEGDPGKSLGELSGSCLWAAKKALENLDDSELLQSVAHLGPVDSLTTESFSVGEPSTEGGRFRILRPLQGGKGGMGIINVAQDEELGRAVALKQIRTDRADHTEYRRKFQIEAEITGNLEHPGIVPIYGLGADPSGRPFYAMRLVRGDNLSNAILQFYNDRKSAGVDYDSVEFHSLIDRLIDVAQAVSYAHGRGVLHRDLKPGNILVGRYGETLVIDWGLARLPESTGTQDEATPLDTAGPLRIRSGSDIARTQDGSMMGTLGYAPPEQVAGSVEHIGKRSDVYALGAILYQMLTGKTPINTKNNGKPRPKSDIINDTQRGHITPPREHQRSAPKPLAAVAMKALAREPSDRYVSADELIAELKRWQADQPVLACRESIPERFGRLLRRHRAATLATVATILGISIVAAVAAILINEQRQVAENARFQEEEARQEAETVAERKQKVVDIFISAFRSPDPDNEGIDHTMSAKEVLFAAQQTLEEELEKDPLTKASLLHTLGRSFGGLGEYDASVSSYEEAFSLQSEHLGADDPVTLTTMGDLGYASGKAGRLDDAIKILEKNLRLSKANLGIDDSTTLATMNNLANAYRNVGRLKEALLLSEEALRLGKAKLGDAQPQTLAIMGSLASIFLELGQVDKALLISEETLRLEKAARGDSHPHTLTAMNNLAYGYVSAGQVDKALLIFEESLHLAKAKLGADHPQTLRTMTNIASIYQKSGQLNKALPLHEHILRLTRAKLGNDHPDALSAMNSLASGYEASGQLSKAIPIFEETLKLRKAKLGDDHPRTLSSMNNLGKCYYELGQLDKALPIFEETLQLVKEKLGADHPHTLTCMSNLAAGYESAGQLDKAIPLHEEALALKRSKLGIDHPNTLLSMSNLGIGYYSNGQLDKALPLLEETLRLRKAKLGDDHPDSLDSMDSLGGIYIVTGKLDAAISLLQETLRLNELKRGEDHPATLTTMNNLAVAYMKTANLDKAIPLCDRTLRLRMAKLGEDHPDTLGSMNNLAKTYATDGQWKKALPLYEKTLRLVKANLGPDHPTALKTARNLADVYLSDGQLTKALSLLETTLRECHNKLGDEHPDTLATMNSLGVAYQSIDQLDKAKKLIENSLHLRKANLSSDHPDTRTSLQTYQNVLLSSTEFKRAEMVVRDWLVLLNEMESPNSQEIAVAETSLAAALLGQYRNDDAVKVAKNALHTDRTDAANSARANSIIGLGHARQQSWNEAEVLLTESFHQLKQQLSDLAPHLRWYVPRACERVIEMYELWEKPHEFAEWKEELAEIEMRIVRLRIPNIESIESTE